MIRRLSRSEWKALALISLAVVALPALANDEGKTDAGAASDGAASVAPPPEGGVKVGDRESLTESLQGKEGVRIQTMCTHCNSANIQVGGLSADLVPMSRGGYPIFGGLGASMILSILPGDTVAEAEVVKGPSVASVPGRGAGGAIRLEESRPEELPSFTARGESGANGLGSGVARISGPITKWLSGSIVAGITEVDEIDDDEDGFVDTPAVDRQFAEGRVVLTPWRDHTFDLGVSWIDEENLRGRGAFDVIAAVSSFTEPVTSWTTENAFFERFEYRAGWEWRMRDGGRLTARALRADRDQTVSSQLSNISDYLGPGRDTSAFFDRFLIDDENTWAEVVYSRPLSNQFGLELAIDGHDQEIRADSREVFDLIFGGPTEAETAIETVDERSAFARLNWIPSARWSVDLGVRWDETQWEGRTLRGEDTLRRYAREDDQVSPRLTVAFKPTTGLTFKALAGRTFRAPKPILSEVCCGQTYQINEFVRSESGTSYGLEAVYQPSPDLKVSAYVSRATFDDYIMRIVGWSQFYIQTYINANVPEARAETAEIALSWSPTPWLSLDGSIGWLDFANTGDRDVTFFIAPPSFGDPGPQTRPFDEIPYQPERTGSIAATVTLRREIQLTASANYTGPMLIQQYADDPLTGPPNLLLDELRETPGFWLVGLAGSVPLTPWLDLEVGVDNVGDEIQDDLGDPTTDYNWGPLVGRVWRAGLRAHFGGR